MLLRIAKPLAKIAPCGLLICWTACLACSTAGYDYQTCKGYYRSDRNFPCECASPVAVDAGAGLHPGFVTTERDGLVLVERVFRGSPAEAAGVVAGDVLVGIDGKGLAAAFLGAGGGLPHADRPMQDAVMRAGIPRTFRFEMRPLESYLEPARQSGPAHPARARDSTSGGLASRSASAAGKGRDVPPSVYRSNASVAIFSGLGAGAVASAGDRVPGATGQCMRLAAPLRATPSEPMQLKRYVPGTL